MRAAQEPTLPYPWTTKVQSAGGQAELGSRLAEHVDAAAAGRLLAAVGALERDRLAGADRRSVAVELAVLVHHPGHHLGVGVDVGGRDVARRAEDLLDLVHEGAGDRSAARSDSSRSAGTVDPALGAAEGDVRDGRLPGHQRGEGADLIDVDLGVVADAALVGAACTVVLDPVAREGVDLAVGELHRDLDGDLAVRGPEDGADVVGQLEALDGPVEVVADDVEVGDLRAAGLVGPARRSAASGSPPVQVAVALVAIADAGPLARQRRQSLTRAFTGVRIPAPTIEPRHGAIAQLGERFPCTEEVAGSSPAGSILRVGSCRADPPPAGRCRRPRRCPRSPSARSSPARHRARGRPASRAARR